MSVFFGDGFARGDPGWKPDPPTRGTYNILSTCLVTLGLCIWTAIHLNIPEYRASWRRQVWRKIGWMVLGFIAPELVAFTAFQQYSAARSLSRKMKVHFPMGIDDKSVKRRGCFGFRSSRRKEQDAVLNKNSDVEESPGTMSPTVKGRKHKWTIVHSYFAVMGGFAVQIADDEPNFFPTLADGKGRHIRLTLTPEALIYLEERVPGLVPDISKLQIEDKSKGSILAKSIVCFQAIWFCIQCLSRVTQGLAISLLELNIFGHAVCTVLIYSLWWSKPLDIEEPEVITIRENDTKLSTIMAQMCKVSDVDRQQPYREDRRQFHIDIDTVSATEKTKKASLDIRFIFRKAVHVFDQAWASIISDRKPSVNLYLTIELSRTFTPSLLTTDPSLLHPLCIPLSPSFSGHYTPPSSSFRATISPSLDLHALGPLPLRSHIDISPLDLRRWIHSQLPPYKPAPPPNSLSPRLRNTPRFTGVRNEWPLYVTLGLSGLLYGGLHCLAWNVPFPAPAEQVLWRLASVTVASTGGLVALVLSWESFTPFWREDPLGAFWFAAALALLGAGGLERWYAGGRKGEKGENRGESCGEGRGGEGVEGEGKGEKRVRRWEGVVGFIRGVVAVPLHVVAYGPGIVAFLLKIGFDLAVPAMVGLYVVARVYLVVESFGNLEHLPESAYELPQWSMYVPHIG